MHGAVVSYETILLCVLWHKYIEVPPLLMFCKPLGYDGAYNHFSLSCSDNSVCSLHLRGAGSVVPQEKIRRNKEVGG